MKLKKLKYIVVLLILFLIPLNVNAKEKVTLYLFYGDGCPHCAKEKEFLKEIENKYDNLEIVKYEVWYNKNNSNLLSKVKKALNTENSYVPYTVIGEVGITGFSETIESDIIYQIEKFSNQKHTDIVKDVLSGKTETKNENQNETDKKEDVTEKPVEDREFNLPILGKVKAQEVSLPIVAIILGALDGFNPCAMWVLLFLISMLLPMKDGKRKWTLGITFLLSSALIYLLFMVAWLQVALTVTQIMWVRVAIAIVAIIAGLFNLQKFTETKEAGCTVTNKEQKKKIINKIKKFTSEKSFLLAIIGVITLSFSVNLVELACSAGLPLLFTQILALNSLPTAQYWLYIILYIFFFLLDDLIIFAIAMFTMKLTGISNKYTKWSHLIGGMLMLIIGVLLIIKPEILMFNF